MKHYSIQLIKASRIFCIVAILLSIALPVSLIIFNKDLADKALTFIHVLIAEKNSAINKSLFWSLVFFYTQNYLLVYFFAVVIIVSKRKLLGSSVYDRRQPLCLAKGYPSIDFGIYEYGDYTKLSIVLLGFIASLLLLSDTIFILHCIKLPPNAIPAPNFIAIAMNIFLACLSSLIFPLLIKSQSGDFLGSDVMRCRFKTANIDEVYCLSVSLMFMCLFNVNFIYAIVLVPF